MRQETGQRGVKRERERERETEREREREREMWDLCLVREGCRMKRRTHRREKKKTRRKEGRGGRG
jgi:hypothetical protein